RESGGLVMRCISSKSPLAASVSEMPDAVRLRIKASGHVEPGSVEVRFAGRQAVVLARDAEGRTIRSQPLRLPAPVVEEGSSADYDADGALVMTFRKPLQGERRLMLAVLRDAVDCYRRVAGRATPQRGSCSMRRAHG